MTTSASCVVEIVLPKARRIPGRSFQRPAPPPSARSRPRLRPRRHLPLERSAQVFAHLVSARAAGRWSGGACPLRHGAPCTGSWRRDSGAAGRHGRDSDAPRSARAPSSPASPPARLSGSALRAGALQLGRPRPPPRRWGWVPAGRPPPAASRRGPRRRERCVRAACAAGAIAARRGHGGVGAPARARLRDRRRRRAHGRSGAVPR